MANFRTLDLNLLRVFDALIATRNVTRAAEVLGLTQPAVSAALGRLRQHLDDPLFVRVGNGMVPTARAEALQVPIGGALRELAGAIEVSAPFDPATVETTFTLRGADSFSMHVMPVLAGRLATEAPGVALTFLDSGYGDMTGLIETGAIDLALEQPMEVPDWVSTAALFRSPFLVVAARDNAEVAAAGVREGEVFPLELFCALPHALRSTDGSNAGMTDVALAERGVARRVVLVLPHFTSIMMAVARSRLISVVPVQIVAELAESLGLAVYRPPFDFPVPVMRLYWHRRLDNAAPHRWLRKRVLETVREVWGTREEA
jgi:DNA-binding transcriptional LysR family regulator